MNYETYSMIDILLKNKSYSRSNPKNITNSDRNIIIAAPAKIRNLAFSRRSQELTDKSTKNKDIIRILLRINDEDIEQTKW